MKDGTDLKEYRKMTYYYRGWDMRKLDAMIDAAMKKLDENDNHLTLKNGDDIEVYVGSDGWLFIDDPEYGGRTFTIEDKYEAILKIVAMSRRGL